MQTPNIEAVEAEIGRIRATGQRLIPAGGGMHTPDDQTLQAKP